MCRCLQNLWEDFYWHCIEEKFCFDETIAYYNPDEDHADQATKKKSSLGITDAGAGFGNRKNSEIIVTQPLARHCSTLGGKAHEDEFQREIQTTVPILAPEVMAAFAQSQIFHEKTQKPKAGALARVETKAKIMAAADVNGSNSSSQDAAAEKLLSRLEGSTDEEEEERPSQPVHFKLADEDLMDAGSKAKTFASIAEEEDDDDVVDLRHRDISVSSQTLSPSKKRPPVHLRLKHVQSVPQFPTYPSPTAGRPWSQSGETMTKDGIFIINTPEVPAIALKRLPRNYLDTPSLDRYKESSSLSSIQMENKRRVDDQFNFQMPRYYGHSELYLPTPAISQEDINRANIRAKQTRVSLKKNKSMVNLNLRSASPDPKSASTQNIMLAGQSEGQIGTPLEKSKRLKVLRGNLPPLMIQAKSKTAEKDRD